ncbi:basal cell adhesion molecule [Pseudophryne corroboree]|uniref:basal cell adhesion molecule n=1 Tax=Pseudophryne corroboree TaxID=495146 RepID=UPI0030815A8D
MGPPAAHMDVLLLALLLPGCLCAVTVSVPPKVEVESGHEAVFKCTPKFSGSPKYSVEWSFTDREGRQSRIAAYNDGRTSVEPGTDFSSRVDIKNDNSLVIRDVRVKDENTFQCRVSAGSEGSGEGSSELRVYVSPSAPELTVNTQVLSVTDSDASEVGTCTSRNSYPAPTIEWYRNQVPLNAGTEKGTDLYASSRTTTEASGLYTVSSKLFLKPTKEDAEAVFSCKVAFPLPKDTTSHMESKEFKLSIHYYTENVMFTVLPDEPIKEGDTVTLRCEGDGNPSPTYLFHKLKGTNDEELNSSDGIYVFDNISRNDAGKYRCEALDFDSPEHVELIKELEFEVHYLNPVTVIPSEQEKHSIGGDIQLFCSCDGSEKPNLVWKKDQVVLSENSRYRLRNLSYSDSGVYTCEATVATVPGLHKEQSISVIVEGPPMLEFGNDFFEVPAEGEMLTLVCEAKGYPEPEITWNPPELKGSRSVSGLNVVSEVSVKVTSKLINDVSCKAQNSLGTKEKKFTLSISSMVAPSTAPAQEQSGGSSTAIIAVVVCVILLLLVVALFYFLQKKGKLACGRSEKQPLSQDPASAELAVELKSEKRHDQRGLLGSHGGGGPSAEC